MKQGLVLLLLVVLLSGCSTYAASRYSISTDNVVALRTLNGKTINIGAFSSSQPGQSEIMCRGVGPIKTPDGEPFSEFIRKALTDELRMANAFSPNDTNESVFGASSDTSGKEMRGAGFGDYETNQKVEQSAISFVTKWYQSHGWTVHSVEAEKCGFDLHCVLKADEEHVEVKGIQGERQSFLITTSEVRQAENNPRFVLCVVTSALSDQAMMLRFTGKEFLDIFKLEPLVFKASVRPNTGCKGL